MRAKLKYSNFLGARMKEDYGALILRLTFALLFLVLGFVKAFTKPVAPEPFLHIMPFLSYIFPVGIAILEIVIGILLLAGLFTRLTAIISSLYLFTILILVTVAMPTNYTMIMFHVTFLGSMIALAFFGSERYSMDEWLNR